MRIKCGNYDVYANGSVIGFNDSPVVMTLSEGGTLFTFKFHFVNDLEDCSERVDFNSTSDDELDVFIYNCNRAFGTGTLEPIELGTLMGRELFLSYRIYSSGNSPEKLFHYTWYLGAEQG